MRDRRGFTRVELIVVLVVLAIVAALMITGMKSGVRESNEKATTASLKILLSAEADFRRNDRDGNKILDF